MKIILDVDDALGEAVIQTSTAKELVRCKDCINRYSICPMITFHYSSGAISTITYRAQDDWWCCFGKRKEE